MRNSSSPSPKRETNSPPPSLLSKTGYKFWLLTAVLLLALWFMFTGSVSLKWSSSSDPSRFSDARVHEDLDILEVEEREKVVRRTWDVYTHRHSSSVRLPRFWIEAFEAAYESLTSDVLSVRNAAFTEIAKLSIRSFNVEPIPLLQSSTIIQTSNGKLAKRSKEATNDHI